MNYPINRIRSDFPILKTKINNNKLIYLDSASSSQKPKIVISNEKNFYKKKYSAVHRGTHKLSIESTKQLESIRLQISKFINADSEEIIFVKNSTEGINLVANSLNKKFLKKGNNIIITQMEHHSNIVPWILLAKRKKLKLNYIPILPNGKLNLNYINLLINKKTSIFCITQVSNVLGTINPIKKIISYIRNISNALILVDGSQAIMHQEVNVKELDCDFYVFSGHKIYGPSGIGILYGKKSILNNISPWQVGGGMINTVSLTEGVTYQKSPWKFEAGSPNISGIIGLGSAISYIKEIGLKSIEKYENKIIKYTLKKLKKIPGLILYGPKKKIGVISFNLKKNHAYDVGTFLDQYGIALRTGHHCAMPLMNFFNVKSMCRISIAIYTNFNEIDIFIEKLIYIQNLLNK
ncbi:SufS family cysteine desulfurase [Sodalis-like secondary symbiont of Drepanosiphum platanoidis]|uniref:SufS family cysteine desulfurase n=1 Tax=Sodalis-like secondary symbiont of Drepanosiphum platanoidis TaxID=2994493 RepID=UPI00346386E1